MDEIKSSAYLYSNIKSEVLKQRLENILSWNIRKAILYKRYYYIFSCISIVAPLLVTILHSIDSSTFIKLYMQTYSAILATITTMSSSLLALFHFRDEWKDHRETVENIKALLMKYNMKFGEFKDGDEVALAEAVENIVAKHNVDELSLIDKEDKSV